MALAYVGIMLTLTHGYGIDSHAYWLAWRGDMYTVGPAVRDAYLYSPAFAQVIWPLAQLPWPAFGVLVSTLAAVSLYHLTRPSPWFWRAPLLVICTYEVLSGNIFWMLALVAVYGMRRPGLWALVALTKLTPAVGVVWFLVRGEWRRLAEAVVVTLVAALISWLMMPEQWLEWVRLLLTHSDDLAGTVGGSLLPPPIYRIPAAFLFVAWGARTSRIWTIPVSMILASPVFGLGSLALLAALPRIVDTHAQIESPPDSDRSEASSHRNLGQPAGVSAHKSKALECDVEDEQVPNPKDTDRTEDE